MENQCNLCSNSLHPILRDSNNWKLILNRNQNLLGKCFLVLSQHEEDICNLNSDEWADLHNEVKIITQSLNSLFQPDHYNYAFLQNLDKHIHFHIIQRYSSERKFGNTIFIDPDFPSHYSVPGRNVLLDDIVMELLSNKIRTEIERHNGRNCT